MRCDRVFIVELRGDWSMRETRNTTVSAVLVALWARARARFLGCNVSEQHSTKTNGVRWHYIVCACIMHAHLRPLYRKNNTLHTERHSAMMSRLNLPHALRPIAIIYRRGECTNHTSTHSHAIAAVCHASITHMLHTRAALILGAARARRTHTSLCSIVLDSIAANMSQLRSAGWFNAGIIHQKQVIPIDL